MNNLFTTVMTGPDGLNSYDGERRMHELYQQCADQVRKAAALWGDKFTVGATEHLFSHGELVAIVSPDGTTEVSPGQHEIWDAALAAADEIEL